MQIYSMIGNTMIIYIIICKAKCQSQLAFAHTFHCVYIGNGIQSQSTNTESHKPLNRRFWVRPSLSIGRARNGVSELIKDLIVDDVDE